MERMTKKQFEVLQFIETSIAEKGVAPSFREIGAKFHLKSLGSVYRYVHVLEKKGLLKKEGRRARSLNVNKSAPVSVSEYQIPLIGTLKGGMPLELQKEVRTLPVLESLVRQKESTYLLEIQGDTLKEEFILEGDLVLIEARSTAFNGEMVLVLINEHDTLIKRYYADPPYVRLESSNPEVQPLILRESHITIQGIILALQRKF